MFWRRARFSRERRAAARSTVQLNAQAEHGRVLVVAPQPLREDRGTPIATRFLIAALSELGYHVDVCTLHKLDCFSERVRVFAAWTPFSLTTIPVGFSFRKFLLGLSILVRVCVRIARQRYICIHAIEDGAFFTFPLTALTGIPLIYDMASSIPDEMSRLRLFRSGPFLAILRFLERSAVCQADHIICSAGLAQHIHAIERRARVNEWRFPAVAADQGDPGGRELRFSLGIPRSAPVILYSGTFQKYQGLSMLVAAVPHVLAAIPDAVFVLVGARGQGEVELMRAELPDVPSANFHILAQQPRARMDRFYAMADVLVSPRIDGRNAPLKVFDYMASGKPMIASDVPAHRAVLDEQRALLVRPTTEDLANGITQLLRDPALGRALAGASRRYAEQNLQWESFVSLVRNVYEDVAALPDGQTWRAVDSLKGGTGVAEARQDCRRRPALWRSFAARLSPRAK